MFAVGRGSSGRRSKYKVDQWREAKFEVHTIVTATVKLSDVEMATEGEEAAVAASSGPISEAPSRITRLDEAVVNRIAAGEIIQRPSNAIKELIENSLDAGAKAINVTVKQGGLKVLQIQDDGKGIDVGDLGIVCERFTTSKLRKFEDLNSIATYGFRGEALASISHVAHVTITTRTAGGECAYKARYCDSKPVPLKAGGSADPTPCAGNRGTQITVEDLFYNVPTRRRALSNPNDEYRRVNDVIARYAIHNSGVAFSLKKVGDATAGVRTAQGASKVDNIRTIFGSKVSSELLEFNCSDDRLHYKMTALASNANYSMVKGTVILFINHRLVESSSIKKALDAVYAQYLPKNHHPFVYLSMEIAPQNIDVNVHPTKLQVHFLHEDAIVEQIQQCFADRLVGANASRTYLTQALLPGVEDPAPAESRGRAAGKGSTPGSQNQVDGKKGTSQKRTSKKSGEGDARVYDYQLVRTDSRAQTLDAFVVTQEKSVQDTDAEVSRPRAVGPASAAALDSERTSKRKVASVPLAADDWDPIKQRPRKKTRADTTPLPQEANCDCGPAGCGCAPRGFFGGALEKAASGKERRGRPAPESLRRVLTWPESECELTSINNLREEILAKRSEGLQALFAEHTFVGCIDEARALIQFRTKLYVVHTRSVSQVFFAQLVLRGFGSFEMIEFKPTAPIARLLRIELDSGRSGWSEEDGPKDVLVQEMTDLLVAKADLLREYFSIEVNTDGMLCGLPVLLDNYCPDFGGLPQFLFRLAVEVNWESEVECLNGIARELGSLYRDPGEGKAAENDRLGADAKGGADSQSGRWMIEHCVFPGLRGMFAPPAHLQRNGSIVEIADLHQLYKIFERC